MNTPAWKTSVLERKQPAYAGTAKVQVVVYSSYSLATAALETLIRSHCDLAPDFVLLTIGVPDNLVIDVIDRSELQDNWASFPGSRAAIRGKWVKKNNALMLEVPSVASPSESNIVINPVHPDADRCSITLLGSYEFDDRLKP